MHPFYGSIMEIYISKDEIKKALAKIYGAADLIEKFNKQYLFELRSIRYREGYKIDELYKRLNKVRREAYGRVTSVIKSLKKELKALSDIVKIMKRIPDLDPSLPTVVVAGPPNSGKSSLVKTFSNAKVEVASYPFTTKNITFGIMEIKRGVITKKVQLVDTPGIFDRPISEKKKEELLAINALKTIANLVIFLFDGSIEAVAGVGSQISILTEVTNSLEGRENIILAINKIDIADEEIVRKIEEEVKRRGFTQILKISITQRKGLEKIIEHINKRLLINSGKS